MTAHAVAGFRFGGISAGIKESGRPDLGLLLADGDVPVAAVFTRSRVKAAPVLLSQERAKTGLARAILVHSGNANACTGKAGHEVAVRLLRGLAGVLGCDERRVLGAGTGVIGVPLPLDRVARALPLLVEATHEGGFDELATAMLTTDRTTKIAYAEVGIGRGKARVLGCAKGSGMVSPNMATTLAFIVTDAAVDGRWLRGALREDVDQTFNEISIDGETSPNDSIFVLASGRAENRPLDAGPTGRSFRAALRDVLEELAVQVVRDGAGATRVVTIEVAGTQDARLARQAARRVGASSLVKAAIFGGAPDWGRLLVALGSAGIETLDPERVDIHIGDVQLVKAGVPVGVEAEVRAFAVMARDTYTIRIHLHGGRFEGRHITCDLGHGYLTVHSERRL